jgi:type IV secretory pathway VirJ component
MKVVRRATCAVVTLLASAATWAASTFNYPGLGTVTVEQPTGAVQHVVIFLSGDGGWNKGVVDMARHLAGEGALVAGVDVNQMQRHAQESRAACVSAAGTLEGLSHYVEQKFGLQRYEKPLLVGYSSGATLAYATLAQAPAGTFKGAISLGFCPDLEWSKPLCRGEGLAHEAISKGFVYRPATKLQDPWIALQGEQDEVCLAAQTREFVGRVPGGELILLPKVGHGFSVEKNWLPQFSDAFHRIAAADPSGTPPRSADVADLPLVELPVRQSSQESFAIMLSGDGGWAGLDKEVAAELNARGVAVVGWDSLRYFWHERTPEEAAHDLDRTIRHYAHAWNKPRVLLIGYSQGADVLPFMFNRLPETTRRQVEGTALIALSSEAFFEFSLSHWIHAPTGGLPVLPEVERGSPGRLACIYGADEADSLCPRLNAAGLRRIELPGGHHFDGDYARVAGAVLDGLRQPVDSGIN